MPTRRAGRSRPSASSCERKFTRTGPAGRTLRRAESACKMPSLIANGLCKNGSTVTTKESVRLGHAPRVFAGQVCQARARAVDD